VTEGYFPRGSSVLRRVHGARIVGVLYGQRALLLQATDPIAFEGLMAGTGGLDAPFQRLAQTAKTMETVFFGSRAEADRVSARVRAMHERTPAATQPEFLLWILACLADSAQAAYERFVRRLEEGERAAFWEDYLTVGELFGLARSDAPAGYRTYRDYMRARLEGDALEVIPRAREIGRMVAFDLPLPAPRRPALRVVNLCVLGLLPARVREMYGLRWSPAHEAAFQAVAASSRAAAPVTPNRLRRGPSAADYDLVARTERRRLAEREAA
jgi:uncharacterized protein (DUF2236 family)